MMNPMLLLMPDETPTRLDKLGDAFVENSNNIENEEAFELLADLFDVPQSDLADHFGGRLFVTEKYSDSRKEK